MLIAGQKAATAHSDEGWCSNVSGVHSLPKILEDAVKIINNTHRRWSIIRKHDTVCGRAAYTTENLKLKVLKFSNKTQVRCDVLLRCLVISKPRPRV